jgi:hypothetical protein
MTYFSDIELDMVEKDRRETLKDIGIMKVDRKIGI